MVGLLASSSFFRYRLRRAVFCSSFLILMMLGLVTARLILSVSGTPDSVMDQALLYIRIYFVCIPFMTVYNFGAAILRSYGDTRRPMYYLIVSGTVNVILNLVLVICFKLGVAGVAIATVISNVISAGLVILCLHRKNNEFQFRFEKMHIEKQDLMKVLQIGIPAGIQGAIFSISNVFIQSGINSFGEDAIAGSSLALNFEYFTYDIAAAFAQAAVTFTSQNYGAGNLKRCKKIFWLCMLFGVVFTEILSVIFMIWDDFFVSIYTVSETVALYGLIRMHHVCSLEGLTATYEVESAALRKLLSVLRGGERGTSWNGEVVGAVHYYDSRHGCFPHDLACDGIQAGSDLRYADECVCCIVDLHRSCNLHCLCASYEARREKKTAL